MGFMKKIVGGALGGALFGGLGLLGGIGGKALVKAVAGGKKKPVVARPAASEFATDDGRAEADALRKRRGRSADMVTGAGGAEASASSVGRLVVGS